MLELLWFEFQQELEMQVLQCEFPPIKSDCGFKVFKKKGYVVLGVRKSRILPMRSRLLLCDRVSPFTVIISGNTLVFENIN